MEKCNMEERVQKCHFETDVFLMNSFTSGLHLIFLFDLMFKLLSRCIKYVQMVKILFSNLEPYTVVWSCEMHFFVHFISIYSNYINSKKTVTRNLSK